MRNLFGFNPEYVDRYSGLSDHEKYKKLVSKSNVDMVLNHFTPFTKAKNLKAKTSTIVSIDDTNIEGVEAPIAFHGASSENKIYVNNAMLGEKLKEYDVEDRDEMFKTMMKGAYVARSDKDSINKRISNEPMLMADLHNGVDDHGMTVNKADAVVNIHKQVLVGMQMVQQDVLIPSTKSVLSPLAEKDEFLDFAHALLANVKAKSKWAQEMMADLTRAGKTRGEYNALADRVMDKIDQTYGTVNQQDMEEHEFTDVMSEMSPTTAKYAPVKPKNDGGEDAKEACSVGNGRMEYNEEPVFAENAKKNDADFSDANDVLEMEDIDLNTQRYFFQENSKVRDEAEWNLRDQKMSVLAEALYDSLSGKIGKRVSQNPAKRLNTRALASDMTDNIYKSKVPLGGKKLSLNMIVDTSGSMGGTCISDAVDVVNCINKLALRGVITGNLMLSASGASAMIKLPINDDLLPKISAHNGGEGFKHTMALRWKELKAADYNVALTDGMLTDGYIDQTAMGKEGIEITGLYSMRSIKDDKKKATEYSGSLKRWFTNSAVRSNAEEMIYYLIDNAILNYDQNPRRVA